MDSGPDIPAAGPGRRRRFAVVAAVVLVLVAAYAVPRVVGWWGVTHTHALDYIDMTEHLLRLDVLEKHGRLPEPRRSHPLVEQLHWLHEADLKWPPAVPAVASVWARPFGPLSIWTVQLTNAPFVALMVVGLVGLGRALGSARAGVLAALLALLSPWLLTASWYFSLDLPLAGMTTVGLWLVAASRGLSRPGPAAALGVWSALGALVKAPYAFFVGPAVIAAAGHRLVRGPDRGRALLGLALVGTLSLGLFAALTRPSAAQIEGLIDNHFVNVALPAAEAEVRGPAVRAVIYLLASAAEMPLPLLLLAVPGIWLLMRRPTPAAGRWVVLPALVGSYVVLSVMASKLPRYALPAYPLLALATALWALTAVRRRWRAAAAGAVVALHASLLLAAFWHPLPWFQALREIPAAPGPHSGPEPPASLLHLGETATPSREHIALLRRFRTSAMCDPRALDRALRDLAGRVPPDEPVLLVEGAVDHDALPESAEHPALVLAQRLRRRYVLFCRRDLPCPRADHHIVVSGPTGRHGPRWEGDLPVAHRTATGPCPLPARGDRPYSARLTLYRRP